ncbi:MAG: NAAT family transporter [Myxococcales bacterium]|nr:NAAT family transporter [Myxococcales bacterium]
MLPPLVTETVVAFGSLFSIVDPFSALPVFVALTGEKPREYQSRTALRASLTCFVVLSVFAAAGSFIFKFFGITIPAFKVAGGILLFGVALDMMRAQHSETRTTKEEETEKHEDVGLIPLGLPLLSGPGAIAAVMVLAGQAESTASRVAVHVAILGIGASAFLILRSAAVVGKLLGTTGIRVIGRLMGLILAAIAIQFVIDGAHEAFPKTFS